MNIYVLGGNWFTIFTMIFVLKLFPYLGFDEPSGVSSASSRRPSDP